MRAPPISMNALEVTTQDQEDEASQILASCRVALSAFACGRQRLLSLSPEAEGRH